MEEPEAALVIWIALNKRTDASMKIAHTEIMNTLAGLCKPDPGDVRGLCKQLNLDPSQCALSGDADSDLLMARRAGIDERSYSAETAATTRLPPPEC